MIKNNLLINHFRISQPLHPFFQGTITYYYEDTQTTSTEDSLRDFFCITEERYTLQDFLKDTWSYFTISIERLLLNISSVVWHRGIKLTWHRLYVRKDEFHTSLDMDINTMLTMNELQRENYLNDLMRRRQIAHERDLND